MSIEMQINSQDIERLLRKLDPAKSDVVIRKSLYESAQYIARWVKDKRLTGPRPKYLGVISDMLRGSIHATPTERNGNTYKARIGSRGVPYARAHEFGYPPRNLPARPFLRPALEDRKNIAGVKADLVNRINVMLGA